MTSHNVLRKLRNRVVITAGIMVATWSGSALSFDFELFGVSGSLDNSITLGAAWRMEERNPDLIGKSNLQPGLCTARRSDGSLGNKEGHTGMPEPGNIGRTCNVTTDGSFNQAYVNEPGSFSPNSDNGNLNYDKKDMVSGAAKWTGDLSFSVGPVGVFLRGIYFFDETNNDFDEYHPDTTLQPRVTRRSDAINDNIGTDFDILDAYLTYGFDVFDRYVSIRVGQQVINWGESAFLIPGSVNNVNTLDVTRLRMPGFDVKELFIPAGMFAISADISDAISMEAFYQYEWVPVVPDQAGSFWSTSDIAGGGTYAMLSFGKAPEDPFGDYDPSTNNDDPIGLISSASRTAFVTAPKTPDDGGEYGLAFKYFATDLNGGTEFGLYYQRYHSRFPIASFNAAQSTCIGDDTNSVVGALNDCGLGGPIGRLGAGSVTLLMAQQGLPIPPELQAAADANLRIGLANEPLPVNTAQVFLEYPEDLDMYGFSFNTLLGDWAWSGEVAHRPETPLQIHTTDLFYASVNPAFPNNSIAIPGVGNLPNRRLAVPDYVTGYRGKVPGSIQGGEYIPGYELMPTYNLETTFLRTIGGDNFLGADQIIVLMELGATFVDDFPDVTELQFNGDGATTHFSNGADGTVSPRDSADLTNSSGDGQANTGCSDNFDICRQNPTQQDASAFATEWSYGYRFVSLIRYQDAFLGINVEPLIGIFGDVSGISPGPGGNFIEGRVTSLLGLRFDYLSEWNGEIRFTDYSGGGIGHQQNDRDFISVYVGYQF